MPGRPFEKGNKFGKGRPKGAKDHKWSSLHYWMAKVEGAWGKLSEKDRAYIAMDAWKTLVKLRPLPPDTPEESLENANRTFKELEDAKRRVIESSGGSISMGDGRSPLQVQTDPSEVQPSMGESEIASTEVCPPVNTAGPEIELAPSDRL